MKNSRALYWFRFLSRLFFALTVMLTPLRWRLTIWQRPFYPVYGDYTDFLLFSSDFAMFFMFLFWLGTWILNPTKIKIGNTFLWICLIGLMFAGWISIFVSVDKTYSEYLAFRFTLLLLFYLYIVNEIHSPFWVILGVAAQLLIQTPIAIGQSILQSSLGLQTFGEYVLDPNKLGTSIISVNGIRVLRAYGLVDHPNILGGSLAFGLVLLLAAFLYGEKRWRLLMSIVFLITFPALLLTYSRSAWVGFFVAASFMVGCEAIAQRWDSVKRAVILGVVSLCLCIPFAWSHLSVFEKRLNSGNVSADDTMQERAYLMQAGNTLFVENSLLGVGLGASPLAMKQHFENFRVSYQPPHFTPLTVSLETGILGGIFYLGLTIFPIAYFLLSWKNFIHQPIPLSALALVIAISVVNLFDYYTWLYVPGRLWQWLAWGLYSSALESRAG